MKKLSLIAVFSILAVTQAQDFRLSEGVTEAQRVIEFAYRQGAKEKSPYHFEKAKTYRDTAYELASNQDDAGAKVFLIKVFSTSSKAVEGEQKAQDITFINCTEVKCGNMAQDISRLNSLLLELRKDKALSCAPLELARAEANYEGLSYELSKSTPNRTILTNLYNKAYQFALYASEKLRTAKENSLECYTGKPFLPEVEKVQEQTAEKPQEEHEKIQGEPLKVTARVHFDFNKATIKKEYIPLLNEVVKVLKENPNVGVRIEGYTDDIGSKAYNDKLALKRAMAVRDYLIKAGIPKERIEVVGFGKERYIASNETPMGRFTNRRVEFIVLQVPGQ
ncbi:MAG: OmpA family protein [Aquificota bacterium]|nr:MAG: OmpA family protein [Aquificota bacterium]